MRPKANKHSRWCMCVTSWERHAVQMFGGHEPHSSEVIMYGKYTGNTMGAIRAAEQNYCEWILASVDNEPSQCESFQRFARYLIRM